MKSQPLMSRLAVGILIASASVSAVANYEIRYSVTGLKPVMQPSAPTAPAPVIPAPVLPSQPEIIEPDIIEPEPEPEPEVYASCSALLASGNSVGDGVYTIHPNGSDPADVYCDMTTDGGGWMFVNEPGRSRTDINDLYAEVEGGYNRFIYDLRGLSYDQVLVQRVNSYWCNSWGSGNAMWGESSQVSMGIAVDQNFFHYHNGQFNPYRWIMQPYSTRNNTANQPWMEPNPTPSNVVIRNLRADGSMVKLVPASTANTWLEVTNYDAFIQTAGGCNTLHGETFKQRVFIR